MFLEIIKSAIFGIVEGITEWLPISSTGHLILVEQFLKFKEVSPEFWGMFQVVIQFGAILAVVFLYWNKIWPITKNKEKAIKKTGILSYFDKDTMNLWGKILVGCIPAAIIGLLFDEVFEALFYNPTCIAIALIVFGIAFIVIENWNKNKKGGKESNSQITYNNRSISIISCNISRYISFRFNNNWRTINRIIKTKCCRIHILFSNTNNVRCKFIKTSKIWFCIYKHRNHNIINWYVNIFYCINACNKILDELY